MNQLLARCLIFSLLANSIVLAADSTHDSVEPLDAAVDAYEHLATVLVEIRKTEDAVVKTIISHHYQAAQGHLKAAQSGHDVLKSLEAAAAEVANVANEGDKRVQAIRQRLAKAGSTHLTDAVTKEDYLWIDSKEKKALVAAARSIAQLGDSATSEKISAAAKDLELLFQKAIAPEQN